MKNQIFARCCLVFTAIFLAYSGFAQEPGMKTLPPIKIVTTTAKVDQKVWDNFRKSFQGAEDVRWYKLDRNFLAKFVQNDQQNTALFNKKGYLLYHIAYGSESNLPDELRKQVKSAYVDFNISRAIKVEQDERTIWVVNVEDANNLILVRLENGELEEVQKLKKSS